ncbi:MAG: fibronectin type III domain-containing protein [Candidatus Diapherotrites archaeon]
MKKIFLLALCVFLCASFGFALSAPIVSSSTNPDQSKWYNGNDVRLSWSADGASKYSYVFTTDEAALPDDNVDTFDNNVFFPNRMEGIWFFKIKAGAGDQWSDVSTFKVQIDRTKPRTPPHFKAVAIGGGIQLSWDAPEDIYSGVESYMIYRALERDFDISGAVNLKIFSDIKGNTYMDSDENFLEGRTYFYKVRAVDAAGNLGSVSIQAFAPVPLRCDFDISFNTPSYTNKQSLDVLVSSSGNFYEGALSVTRPGDSNSSEVVSNVDDSDSLSYTLDLGGVEGNYILSFTGTEGYLGAPCEVSTSLSADFTKPSLDVLSPAAGARLSDIVKLEARASDTGAHASGIDSVKFFRVRSGESALIGSVSDENNGVHSFDWNTLAVANAAYDLNVVAFDRAGNTAAESIKVTLVNTAFERNMASSAIRAAEADANAALALKQQLDSIGVESASFNSFFSSAQSALFDARVSYSDGTFGSAEKSALSASSDFNASLHSISVKNFATRKLSFNDESVAASLKSIWLKQQFIDESLELFRKYDANMMLRVVEVNDSNNIYYMAVVSVGLTNKDSNAAELQLVEVIPKAFAQKASLVGSSFEFAVIEQDPTIKAPVSISPNSQFSFTYYLKKQLSNEESRAYLAEGLLNAFPAPIILYANSKIDSGSFERPLLQLDDSAFVLIGFGVVVLLLVVIVALLFLILRKKQSGKDGLAALK